MRTETDGRAIARRVVIGWLADPDWRWLDPPLGYEVDVLKARMVAASLAARTVMVVEMMPALHSFTNALSRLVVGLNPPDTEVAE